MRLEWAEAEREIETAIGLRTKSTSVYTNAAWFFMCKGTGEKPLREMQRALFVEPSSPALQLFMARMFLHTGNYRRAIDAFSNLIESGPDFSIARRHRAQAFILNRQPAEALADLLLLPQDRAEDIALRLPLLGRAYADCGDRERAEAIYATLVELARTEYVVEFNLATVAVGLGMLDGALAHLERGLQKREPAMLMLRSLPWFEPIEQRARFKALLQAIWPPERPAAPQTTPAYLANCERIHDRASKAVGIDAAHAEYIVVFRDGHRRFADVAHVLGVLPLRRVGGAPRISYAAAPEAGFQRSVES